MAEADELLAEVRHGLMPDGFDFDQAYSNFEDARMVDRTETNIGSYFVLTAAQDELLTNSEGMMAALIRHADPEEARRLGEIEGLSARRAAMVTAIEDAREAGDIARVVELEGLLIGFDATSMRLMADATDTADAIRALPTPKLPAGVNTDELRAGLQAEIDRLTEAMMMSELAADKQKLMDQIGIYHKAQEMAAVGDDPRQFLRDQSEYVKWQALQKQHETGAGQYPRRGIIYPMLSAEAIQKVEDLVRAQGYQLDELQSVEDMLEARRLRIQSDGRHAAGFDDIVFVEDAGQGRRGEFVEDAGLGRQGVSVDDATLMDDVVQYEDLDIVTRIDADVTVPDADASRASAPPLPPARAQHADPDVTKSWEWTPGRPVEAEPTPLDEGVNRTRLVQRLRNDQSAAVGADLSAKFKGIPDPDNPGRYTIEPLRDPRRASRRCRSQWRKSVSTSWPSRRSSAARIR